MIGEREAVRSSSEPLTVRSLARSFRGLGIADGMTLLVHASLRSLGWVCGGAVAAILALEEALGEQGTLMMPTMTGELTDPHNWRNPPVPEPWKDTIRAEMPAYDPHLTPTRAMGAIAEAFRSQPGTLRSRHPHYSFAARGPEAERLTFDHTLDFGMGEGSPLARLYELDGSVLLLGVGHDRNASIHLAEYRAEYPEKRTVASTAPMITANGRQRVTFQDLAVDETDFPRIGDAFARESGQLHAGFVGNARTLLMPQRALVDFATAWMASHRGPDRAAKAVSIRPLHPSDRSEWMCLRQALWPQHGPAALDRAASTACPDATVFVAERPGGRLCGLIVVSTRDRAIGCTADRIGYIEGWYVEPGWRRRGIGRRLVDRGEAWARTRGCTEMASDTTPRYPLSPPAHQALGYRVAKRSIHFRKRL